MKFTKSSRNLGNGYGTTDAIQLMNYLHASALFWPDLFQEDPAIVRMLASLVCPSVHYITSEGLVGNLEETLLVSSWAYVSQINLLA